MVTRYGDVFQSNSDISAFTQIYNPSPMMNIRFAIAQGHYLLLFAHLEPGAIQLYNLPLPNAENLLPIDTLPGIPGLAIVADATRNHQMPWATDGENVFFTSGHLPEFDNTSMDIYKYNGSRIYKIAEAYDLANPTSAVYDFGLTAWRGELLLYQLAQSNTYIRMLVGDRFVDFVDLSGTDPLDSAQNGYSAIFNLAGRLFVCALDGSDYGFLASKGYQDGHLETSYLDMDKPGRLKRLHRLTAHVQDHASAVTVTISYKLDDDSSWTQAAATANADRIVADNLALDFYRLKLKLAIADTGDTPTDTRIDSLSARYTA
jgi:hypothetical protein